MRDIWAMRLFYIGGGIYAASTVGAVMDSEIWKIVVHGMITGAWLMTGYINERRSVFGYAWLCRHDWTGVENYPQMRECHKCGAIKLGDDEGL